MFTRNINNLTNILYFVLTYFLNNFQVQDALPYWDGSKKTVHSCSPELTPLSNPIWRTVGIEWLTSFTSRTHQVSDILSRTSHSTTTLISILELLTSVLCRPFTRDSLISLEETSGFLESHTLVQKRSINFSFILLFLKIFFLSNPFFFIYILFVLIYPSTNY